MFKLRRACRSALTHYGMSRLGRPTLVDPHGFASGGSVRTLIKAMSGSLVEEPYAVIIVCKLLVALGSGGHYVQLALQLQGGRGESRRHTVSDGHGLLATFEPGRYSHALSFPQRSRRLADHEGSKDMRGFIVMCLKEFRGEVVRVLCMTATCTDHLQRSQRKNWRNGSRELPH